MLMSRLIAVSALFVTIAAVAPSASVTTVTGYLWMSFLHSQHRRIRLQAQLLSTFLPAGEVCAPEQMSTRQRDRIGPLPENCPFLGGFSADGS